jgi:hypothetical protein
VSETIHVLGEGGVVFKMALPLHESIADRLTQGFLKRVNADGSPYVDGEAKPVKPAGNAAKSDWIGWAVHNGADPDDALALTKADLIQKYGQ